MNNQIISTKNLGLIGWLLLRLIIINTIILILTITLAVIRNFFETTDYFVIKFPLQLYVTAFLLTNLVYIIGNVFEIIYLRLWDKKIEIRDLEKKFFKGGLAMTIFVHVIGVIIYLINYPS